MATGRVTKTANKIEAGELSLETLELCDWLIDNMTLSAQADDFEEWAAKIAVGRREIRLAVEKAGGVPIATQRAQTAAQ